MRTYILLPLLALLNMGANAATIQNLISRHSGPHVRSPSQHLNNPISRQVHNADFSSDSSPLSDSQSSSPPTPGSAAARSSSFKDPAFSRRTVAADPESDTIVSDANGDVDDQAGELDTQSLDGVLTTDHGSEGDTVRLSLPSPRRRQDAGFLVAATNTAPSSSGFRLSSISSSLKSIFAKDSSPDTTTTSGVGSEISSSSSSDDTPSAKKRALTVNVSAPKGIPGTLSGDSTAVVSRQEDATVEDSDISTTDNATESAEDETEVVARQEDATVEDSENTTESVEDADDSGVVARQEDATVEDDTTENVEEADDSVVTARQEGATVEDSEDAAESVEEADGSEVVTRQEDATVEDSEDPASTTATEDAEEDAVESEVVARQDDATVEESTSTTDSATEDAEDEVVARQEDATVEDSDDPATTTATEDAEEETVDSEVVARQDDASVEDSEDPASTTDSATESAEDETVDEEVVARQEDATVEDLEEPASATDSATEDVESETDGSEVVARQEEDATVEDSASTTDQTDGSEVVARQEDATVEDSEDPISTTENATESADTASVDSDGEGLVSRQLPDLPLNVPALPRRDFGAGVSAKGPISTERTNVKRRMVSVAKALKARA